MVRGWDGLVALRRWGGEKTRRCLISFDIRRTGMGSKIVGLSELITTGRSFVNKQDDEDKKEDYKIYHRPYSEDLSSSLAITTAVALRFNVFIVTFLFTNNI